MNQEHKHNYQQGSVPEFPTYCRICNGVLDPMPYFVEGATQDSQGRNCKVKAYDIFSGKPRTYEYTLACRENLEHTQLVVLETPTVGFRAVIKKERYDDNYDAKKKGEVK